MTMMSELHKELHEALTAEWYRRAELKIEASPDDHSAAMTDVALDTIADALEALGSDLCDCRDLGGAPPTRPSDRSIEMAHHCECTAVVASRTVRRGAPTLHERECGCGE
jgi:hypothetical protein